jgi:hypothetical protein
MERTIVFQTLDYNEILKNHHPGGRACTLKRIGAQTHAASALAPAQNRVT